MNQSNGKNLNHVRRTVRAGYTRNVLDETRQLFMETCIRRIKAAGLDVRGSGDFELRIPDKVGRWEVIALGEVFGAPRSADEARKAAEVFADEIVSKRQLQLDREREFADAHLRFVTVQGPDVPTRLHELLAEAPITREFPVMLSSMSKTEFIRLVGSASESFAATSRGALEFDLAGWLRTRRQEFDEDGWLDAKTIGEWPEKQPQTGGLTGHLTTKGDRPRKSVPIALLKLDGAWQVSAITRFGGWNEAPEALVQTAFFHSWHDRFGSKIVTQGSDFLECLVASPPTDRESAMELAWEQFLFCPDIVDQGVGSVAGLASVLLETEYWFFWWD
jgi:hypothetical protein